MKLSTHTFFNTGRYDKDRIAADTWTHLVDRAREAAAGGRSWRNFQVGCALLACRPARFQRISPWDFNVFTGANSKPTEHGYNVCAERFAIYQAIAAGYDEILLMAVAGRPQPDTHSGHCALTLHPCGNCRTFLATTPEAEHTRIITVKHHVGVDPTKDDDLTTCVMEWFTLEHLLALHKPT